MPYPQNIIPPWDSPRNALAWLSALRPVYPWAVDFSQVPSYANEIFPTGQTTITTMRQTATSTNSYWLVNGNNVVVVSGGTDGSHAQQLLNSWLAGRVSTTLPGALGAFEDAVDTLINGITADRIPLAANWWMAGHSYGGATVAVLAQWAITRFRAQSVRAWTFGAPRPGTDQFQSFYNGPTLYRYFNREDPVPEIPPHTPEAPLLHFAVPDSMALFVNRQVQVPNGRELMADGTIVVTEDTNLPLNVNEPSIAAWVLGSNLWSAQSHNPMEYERRLHLTPIPPDNPVGPDRTPPQALEEPADISVRLIHQQVDRAIAALPTPIFPPQLPAMMPGDPANRYTIRHRRRGWGVWYNGVMVAFCRSKRAARQIARLGNQTNRVNDQLQV